MPFLSESEIFPDARYVSLADLTPALIDALVPALDDRPWSASPSDGLRDAWVGHVSRLMTAQVAQDQATDRVGGAFVTDDRLVSRYVRAEDFEARIEFSLQSSRRVAAVCLAFLEARLDVVVAEATNTRIGNVAYLREQEPRRWPLPGLDDFLLRDYRAPLDGDDDYFRRMARWLLTWRASRPPVRYLMAPVEQDLALLRLDTEILPPFQQYPLPNGSD